MLVLGVRISKSKHVLHILYEPMLYTMPDMDLKHLYYIAFTTHTGSDLLFAIEQAIATEIQYMIYNTLNSNYLYLLDTLK